MTDVDPSMPTASACSSYWDEVQDMQQERVIVGAGIIGLSTAINLKQKNPRQKVMVIERGFVPMGASTRNAGFACIGSLTEVLRDIKLMGEKKALQQIKERWDGLQLLLSELGANDIGFVPSGSYELIPEELLPCLDEIDELNRKLKRDFVENPYTLKPKALIEELGFHPHYNKAIIFNRYEGTLNSALLMKRLREHAQALGVDIRYGSHVEQVTEDGSHVFLQIKGSMGDFVVKAQQAVCCTNGFLSEILPNCAITPGRGQIIMTEPLEKPLRFSHPVHMNEGFYYFRPLPENRLLLGGGRQLDPQGETTTVMQTTKKMINHLLTRLEKAILAEIGKIEVAKSWSGIMGFSKDHCPLVAKAPGTNRIYCGFGCNGMGVARGYQVGQQTAEMLLLES